LAHPYKLVTFFWAPCGEKNSAGTWLSIRDISASAILVTKTITKMIVCYNTRIKTKMKGSGKNENEIKKRLLVVNG